MWNGQNNGNGNGYGQPQQQYGGQQEDVYGRLNNTRDVGGARFPFIEDGTHKLALCTLEEFQHSSDGPSARILFEVLASNKHAVGSYVVKIYKLVKPAKFQGQATDADAFADFCRKLKGAPIGYPIGNDIRVLMKERPNEQLARGTAIECVGVPNKKGTWTNIYWNAIQQSPQDIAAMRQRLEAKGIPDTKGGPQQMQQQQVSYPAPGMQQYAQPQYAPQPMQQPPQAPPQYAYAQSGYQAPLAPQQPAAPAQAPQGGFLAQIPPQGPGPQGGNNGGGGTW